MKIRREEVPQQLAGQLTELCVWDVVQSAYDATLEHANAAPDGKTGYLSRRGSGEGWQTSIYSILSGVASRPRTKTLRLENDSQAIAIKTRAVIAEADDEYEQDAVINTATQGGTIYTFVSGNWVRQPITARQRNAGIIAVHGGASSYENEPELVRFESFHGLDIESGCELLSEAAGSLLELAGVSANR